jgi:hypothetical protein
MFFEAAIFIMSKPAASLASLRYSEFALRGVALGTDALMALQARIQVKWMVPYFLHWF